MFTYPRFSCMWRYRNNNNTYKVNLSFSKLNTSSLFYFLEWSLFCILNAYHASPIGLLKLANIILNTRQHAMSIFHWIFYDIWEKSRLRLKIEWSFNSTILLANHSLLDDKIKLSRWRWFHTMHFFLNRSLTYFERFFYVLS